MKKPTTTIGLYDEKNEFPLTVPIENKDRQQLAYNMLYYMAEKGASVNVNGVEMSLASDQLNVMTHGYCAMKIYVQPELDPELYGLGEDGKERYAVYSYNDESNNFIQVTPASMNLDKVNGMFDILQTDMDSCVSISYLQDDRMNPVIVGGRPVNFAVMNADKVKQNENYEDFAKAVANISMNHQQVKL